MTYEEVFNYNGHILCFQHLNTIEAHKMEFFLKGMHFDSLRIVTYDTSKDEVLMYPTKPVSERWVTEVPDHIWKMNPQLLLSAKT